MATMEVNGGVICPGTIGGPAVQPANRGSWQIGDFARAKDTLSVIIVEIDTRIYKTYPKLDLTIVPQLSKRYFEFNQ